MLTKKKGSFSHGYILAPGDCQTKEIVLHKRWISKTETDESKQNLHGRFFGCGLWGLQRTLRRWLRWLRWLPHSAEAPQCCGRSQQWSEGVDHQVGCWGVHMANTNTRQPWASHHSLHSGLRRGLLTSTSRPTSVTPQKTIRIRFRIASSWTVQPGTVKDIFFGATFSYSLC